MKKKIILGLAIMMAIGGLAMACNHSTYMRNCSDCAKEKGYNFGSKDGSNNAKYNADFYCKGLSNSTKKDCYESYAEGYSTQKNAREGSSTSDNSSDSDN